MFKKFPMRSLAATMLAATLLIAPASSQALAAQDGSGSTVAADTGTTISVTGQLQWVTVESPHWELGGYVLIVPDNINMQAYEGQEVRVSGTRNDGPSIYMRPVLHVTTIEAKATGGGTGPGPVISPIISPAPSNEGALQPFNGTSNFVIFGEMKRVVGIYRTDDLLAGRYVISSHVDLAAYTGQKVAAVVKYSPSSTGEGRYEVLSVVRVGLDLGASGDATLYRAPAQPIAVSVMGQTLNQQTLVGNGRALLPLRSVATALGATDEHIVWNQATQTASVTLGDRTVKVTVGSNVVTVQKAGEAETMISVDVAPVISGGSTLVPVRVLAEGLGAKVQWDAAASAAVITK